MKGEKKRRKEGGREKEPCKGVPDADLGEHPKCSETTDMLSKLAQKIEHLLNFKMRFHLLLCLGRLDMITLTMPFKKSKMLAA